MLWRRKQGWGVGDGEWGMVEEVAGLGGVHCDQAWNLQVVGKFCGLDRHSFDILVLIKL